jgi:hypothetical protein
MKKNKMRRVCGEKERESGWADGGILYGKSFNLKTIVKAILATLERIIRLFSLKWPKSP